MTEPKPVYEVQMTIITADTFPFLDPVLEAHALLHFRGGDSDEWAELRRAFAIALERELTEGGKTPAIIEAHARARRHEGFEWHTATLGMAALEIDRRRVAK